MVRGPGLLRQPKVPFDGAPLALGADPRVSVVPRVGPVVDVPSVQQGLVLAVRCDDLSQSFRPAHRLPHHLFGLDPLSVIRECDHAVCHSVKIRQFLPLFPDGDSSVGQHLNAHIFAGDKFQLPAQMFRTVRDRVQVRHSADSGVPAPRRGSRPRGDGLFIRKTRFSEMHMHITETGKNNDIIGNGIQRSDHGKKRVIRPVRRAVHLENFPILLHHTLKKACRKSAGQRSLVRLSHLADISVSL